MGDGIFAALSGAIAQQRALDVVANNVANVGTTGFRADRLIFREAVASANNGSPAPDGVRFVETPEVRTDTTAGALQQTGHTLDLALSGDGYFAVGAPDGSERYTRAGGFSLDASGVIRSSQGMPLLDASSAPGSATSIVVPPGTSSASIYVGTDGTVTANGQVIGRVRVVQVDPTALEGQGLTMFSAKNGAQIEDSSAQVMSGYLEGANVGAISGMNELVGATRAFDAFQRVIQAFKQMDERAVRDLAAPT